jgi:uncharacterized protein Usg
MFDCNLSFLEEEHLQRLLAGEVICCWRIDYYDLLNVFLFGPKIVHYFQVRLEVGMVEKDEVSKDLQVLGYGLTTAEIIYRRPDRHWLLQTYVWQDYDMYPNFPALKDFLAFWETRLEGPLFAVTVAHSKLIKPAELRAVDGVFRLH